ncbi:hypothetical protein K8I31_01140 [bacterium]|nr:hypothetical protein [bacterium]
MNERLEIYNNVRRILIRFIEKRLPEDKFDKADGIADQLMIDGEERRDSAQSSINRSKMNLDWLAKNQKIAKVQEQCKLQRSFLDKNQGHLHEKIDVFLGSQRHLIKTVTNVDIDPSVYRAMIIDYIKQCLNVMLLQKSIFQREVEISSEFALNVKEYMRTLLKQFQEKDPEKLMFVAQTMKVLNDGQISVEEIKKLNYQQLNKGLIQFQSRLEERQCECDHVAQAVKQLQDFIKKNQEEFQTQSDEETKLKEEPSSSSRMAKAKRLD